MPIPIQSFVHASWVSVALLASFNASAHDRSGLYVSAYGGASMLGSTRLAESREAMPTLSGKASFDGGIGLGGAMGQRYGNGWAAEVAWDYRRHDLKRIGAQRVSGDFASSVAFINGYYRFQKVSMIRPFAGAGVGYATEIDMDLSRDGAGQEYSRRGGLALQAILGGEMDITERWSVSADVRWIRLSSGSFKSTKAGAELSGNPKYQPTALHVGVAYHF